MLEKGSRMRLLTHSAITLAILLLVMPASALGQAFGIQQGVTVSELDVVEELGDGDYVVNVPQSHSEFEAYVVKASDTAGVCLVRGIGKDHDNDRYGRSVRAAFEKLEDALEDRYGAFKRADFLNGGALWDGANEWVMAIRQNERAHQAIWTADYGSELPSSINEIILTVDALDSSSAYNVLQYRLANYDDCQRELDALDAQGL
jgi:hypothetical protein